jgi:hypothetical protein
MTAQRVVQNVVQLPHLPPLQKIPQSPKPTTKNLDHLPISDPDPPTKYPNCTMASPDAAIVHPLRIP